MEGECSWEPRAYGKVPLAVHNAAVGASVHVLFGDRLRRAGAAARLLDERTGIRGSLALASVLAGAFHDLGKASPAYRDKGSYYGHEIASAALLLLAAEELLDKDERPLALLARLAAWAVARHHSAQKERHPAHTRPGDKLARRAAEALEGLAREPGCAAAGLPRALRGSRIAELALAGLAGRLARERPVVVANWAVRELAVYSKECEEYWEIPTGVWAALASAASGALIVSDILVASREGRDTDEGAGRVYVEWWERELPTAALDHVKSMAGNPRGAEEGLEKALSEWAGSPILGGVL